VPPNDELAPALRHDREPEVVSRLFFSLRVMLGHPLAARLTGMTWCVTFVTVAELWQWATTRSWGTADA
jgi:hypothetical protein